MVYYSILWYIIMVYYYGIGSEAEIAECLRERRVKQMKEQSKLGARQV